jgi:hypothetical protein
MVRKGDDMAAQEDGPSLGTGRAGAAHGASARVGRGQRWLARLAFAAAVAAVLLVSGALRSITALLLGLAGLAIAWIPPPPMY